MPDPSGAPAAEPGAADTLEVVLVFDALPRGSGGLRLRVDGLAEPGLVAFEAPRPGAAAAGLSLEAPARYHGCAAAASRGIELRAPVPPRAKAWLRVSTDRPVRVRVSDAQRRLGPVVVNAGGSALVPWEDR